MITYIVFYLLLLTITFFKDRKMGFILGCIILGVFSSARYYVGADYGYYYGISTQAGRDFYFSNKWFYYNYNLEMDFFKLLSDFALSIECPRLPIIIFAGLNSYFLYKILSTQKFKISKLLVYASFPLFYTLSFTTIPQSLSSLIILYSFLLFKKKKFIKSLMLVLFSVYVHKSALIIIFIFLGLGFILVNKTRIKFFIALFIK